MNKPYKAEKALIKLPSSVYERMIDSIKSLALEPRPSGCKKLKGKENAYRIRVGNYRAIYEIQDDVLIVLIISVVHRKEAY